MLFLKLIDLLMKEERPKLPPPIAKGWMLKQGEGAGANFRRRFFALVAADAQECDDAALKQEAARSREAVRQMGTTMGGTMGFLLHPSRLAKVRGASAEKEARAASTGSTSSGGSYSAAASSSGGSYSAASRKDAEGAEKASDDSEGSRSTTSAPRFTDDHGVKYGLLYYFSSESHWDAMREGQGNLAKGVVSLRDVQEVRVVEGFLELLTPSRVWHLKPADGDPKDPTYWKDKLDPFVKGARLAGRSSRYVASSRGPSMHAKSIHADPRRKSVRVLENEIAPLAELQAASRGGEKTRDF